MSNIEKIRQEIEKQRGFIEGLFSEGDNSFYDGQDDVYNHLLSFIDSLPEETCKDSLQVQETCKENTDSFTENLEKAAKDYAILPMDVGDGLACIDKKKEKAFIAGAKWMESQMPLPEDTVIFMKGVEEGRRLEREDRNDDNLPRYYGD